LGIGGANHIVRAIALSGSDVYVGGQFEVVGRALAMSLARFDGAMWHDLGEGSNGTVDALAFGPTGVLYAGGRFDRMGGMAAPGFAAWDGSDWSVPGGGPLLNVSSIATDPAGNVYVAGTNIAAPLSPYRVMRWDGNVWTALGNWLGEVVCLAYDAAQRMLYAGGSFTNVDGIAASCIARWDGTSWAALGAGVDGWVLDIALDSGGVLYAGGAFTASGGKPLNYIGKWNPASGEWSDLGHGPNNVVRALVLKNGLLHVGGDFTHVGTWPGGSEADYYAVCRPRFKTWSPMGSFDFSVESLALHASGVIYAGGGFHVVQDVVAHSIAKWDGAVWSALGASESVNDAVMALASDHAGNTYLTGDFGWAGVQRTNLVAKWNGSTWEALGVTPLLGQGLMRAAAIDTLGRPHVGGRPSGGLYSNAFVFRVIGSGTGAVMETVGDGLVDGDIRALAFDPTGALHVGGSFQSATKALSQYPANNLALWDGTKYVPVGGGVDNCVQAIAFDPAFHMYVGGWFMNAGGVAVSRIAQWNGSAWSSLNGGTDGPVFALAIGPGGVLYAGGQFTTAGGVAASNIARWDGAHWIPLGTGVDGLVHAIVVDDAGVVVACGRFTNAGGVPAQHVARWDGAAWQPFGGGINGLPVALALDSFGNLAVGGIFSQADGRDSCFFAFYTATPVTVPTNPPGVGPALPPGPPPTEPGRYPDWWLTVIATVVRPLSNLVNRAAATWK
jgi:hypothetical protein